MFSWLPSKLHQLFAGIVLHHQPEYIPGVGEFLHLIVGVLVGVVDSLRFGVEPTAGYLLLAGEPSRSCQEFRRPTKPWSIRCFVFRIRRHFFLLQICRNVLSIKLNPLQSVEKNIQYSAHAQIFLSHGRWL